MSKKAHILIVEDIEENIDILLETLTDEFSVSVAMDGKMALQLVEKQKPDLILLDIQMPVMDGYETCAHLKAKPETASIPVVFLTALNEDDHESRGLDMGAVDYIAKPFNPYLVKARVRNQVELKMHKDHLEQMVLERTRSLREAHEKLRLLDKAKNGFLSAISHELRTPANSVLGVGQLALDYIPDESIKENLRNLFALGERKLIDTINNGILLAEIQNSDGDIELEEVDLGEVLDKEAELLEEQALGKGLKIEVDAEAAHLFVTGNIKLLKQVVSTSLRVALAMGDGGEKVLVSRAVNGNLTGVAITVKGKLFGQDLLKTVFDPYSYERASSYIAELGLAPPLAGAVVAALGGEMKFENAGKDSTQVKIFLPSL